MLLAFVTPIAEAFKKEERSDKKEYWQNKLKSLGIEPRRQNELNDHEELQALAEIIKEVYYQAYKTA
jgi:hypothetical protein